jgi:hypothetical protein
MSSSLGFGGLVADLGLLEARHVHPARLGLRFHELVVDHLIERAGLEVELVLEVVDLELLHLTAGRGGELAVRDLTAVPRRDHGARIGRRRRGAGRAPSRSRSRSARMATRSSAAEGAVWPSIAQAATKKRRLSFMGDSPKAGN